MAEKVRPAIFVVTMSCVKARICNIITKQTNEYEVMNEEEDCSKKKPNDTKTTTKNSYHTKQQMQEPKQGNK